MEYCPRCNEYKGLIECNKCGQLYCAYCDFDQDASCDTHGDIVEFDFFEEDNKIEKKIGLNECE